MPMIDVYAPENLFPADADSELGTALAQAVLRAEGVASPGPFHLDNTAVFIHRLKSTAIHTGSTNSANNVRIQIITPPGSLNREGQRQITKEATEIVTRISGDDTLAKRTWVILTEAAEGGWGIQGTAFGIEEFTALAAQAAAAKAAQEKN
ncbi:tautomerase family protein [Paenibacillus sp. GCM10012307]|uniref:Tautomerase family protein n=2 Tax=Paenibacillus TaxID=44249 RepID=A0A934IWT7_9BACL|nr:tautomerase family protein [Paenibacillus roseus]MBJ6360751.1 tautomerase family protein [Paenibacillus roseus]